MDSVSLVRGSYKCVLCTYILTAVGKTHGTQLEEQVRISQQTNGEALAD